MISAQDVVDESKALPVRVALHQFPVGKVVDMRRSYRVPSECDHTQWVNSGNDACQSTQSRVLSHATIGVGQHGLVAVGSGFLHEAVIEICKSRRALGCE